MRAGCQSAGVVTKGRRPTHGWPWVVVQLLLLAAIAATGWSSAGFWRCGATTFCGYLLLGLGGLIALLGAWQLGWRLSPFPVPRSRARLEENGIYAWLRHPQYAGLMLAAAGWGLVRASPWALLLALILPIVLDGKSRYEERLLREVFPEYAGYANRVRRFIPRVY